jgi:sulfide:quinone oxidoreductase
MPAVRARPRGVACGHDPRAGSVRAIVGGGVGGLESALALQALAGDRVALTLIAPERHFTYRPLAVAEPFGGQRVLRFSLQAIAEGPRDPARARRGRRGGGRRSAPAHQDGETVPYDHLVLATGGRAVEAVPAP